MILRSTFLLSFLLSVVAHTGFDRLLYSTSIIYPRGDICRNDSTCDFIDAPCGKASFTPGTPVLTLTGGTQVTVILYAKNQHCTTGPSCPKYKWYHSSDATAGTGAVQFEASALKGTPVAGEAFQSFDLTIPATVTTGSGILQMVYNATDFGGGIYYSCFDVLYVNTEGSGGGGGDGSFACSSCVAAQNFECNVARTACVCKAGFFASNGACLCDASKNGGAQCDYEITIDPNTVNVLTSGASAASTIVMSVGVLLFTLAIGLGL